MVGSEFPEPEGRRAGRPRGAEGSAGGCAGVGASGRWLWRLDGYRVVDEDVSLLRKANGEYSKTYSFMADRLECEGQCTYCRHAHNQHKWAEIRSKIGHYDSVLARTEHHQVQNLINWSWTKGVNFECILGIIALRLLSFGYSDPLQFNVYDDPNFGVLDFLDTFNAHSGALDLLTSSWAALLAGGWPVFKQLHLVSKKLIDVMDDRLGPDLNYRDAVVHGLKSGEMPALGVHLLAIRRSSGCPVGTAVALLGVALEMIRSRGMYQGSLKDSGNLVYALILTAQAWTSAI
eukprot:g11221.t1